MERPSRGYGDFRSDEPEEPRHSPFHHRPPPPPPPEDEEGGGNFGCRRGGFEEGGRYGRRDDEGERFGRVDDEEGFGRRRGEDEGRFGRGDDNEGYPPEPPRHFPHLGFHGPPKPPHHEGSFPDDCHHSQLPTTDYAHNEPHHVVAEPATDPSLSSKMGSLSLGLPEGRLVRIFCKENGDFYLAVQHNSLQMQESNAEDEAQQWIKDASHGMRIKDSYGYPAFSLVNKKTKKLLKHANELGQQVLLVDYEADMKDDNILWTESQDFGEGYKTVRSASDTLLNLTVFEGNKRIRNGSALVLDSWHKGDHQLWQLLAQ